MSQATQKMIHFPAVAGKPIQVAFDGGEVSSDAGMLFLRETERRVGLLGRLAAVMTDARHPRYITHSLDSLFTQRVFQIIAGYEDADDSDTLRTDPIFKLTCHQPAASGASLASQPTMSRFENSLTPTTLYRLAHVFLDTFIASYATPPAAIVLDIDDTADPTHGAQQQTLFHGHHDTYCYLPLHIYEGQSGKLITTILRPGKTPTGAEITAVLKRVVAALRAAWPEVQILLRGDAHYSAPEVHEWCEEAQVHFVLGQGPNAVLKAHAATLLQQARALYEDTGEPTALYGDCLYQAGSWKRARRVIIKAVYGPKGPDLRFVVTSLTVPRPSVVYHTIYCARGRMEGFIKAHKLHLASGRTSCHRFTANQFRLFLHSAAYVLLHAFRHQALYDTPLAHAQFDTIRLQILKVGARVRELATRINVHLPTSYPWKAVWHRIWAAYVGASP